MMVWCCCCLRRPLASQSSILGRRSLKNQMPWRYYVLPWLLMCLLSLAVYVRTLIIFCFCPCLLQELWTHFILIGKARSVSALFFPSVPFCLFCSVQINSSTSISCTNHYFVFFCLFHFLTHWGEHRHTVHCRFNKILAQIFSTNLFVKHMHPVIIREWMRTQKQLLLNGQRGCNEIFSEIVRAGLTYHRDITMQQIEMYSLCS